MGEKGQSLVEFSISLVFILILLAGTVEFGVALFQYIQLRDAAQEGALYGSICQDVAQIELRARHASSSPLDLTDGAVVVGVEFLDKVDAPTVIINPGGAVRVRMSYVHEIFMPFFAGNDINISVQVTDTILMEGSCK